jgi:hypothetical protein
MKKFLKVLVEMLAVTAQSDVGDSGYDWQNVQVNSAPAPAQRACQVPTSA